MEEPFTEEECFRIEDMLTVMAEAMTETLTSTDRLAHDGELGRRLGMLTSYDVLRRSCERFVDALAHASARAGAEYPDLGQAVKMTRQGAQRRWPDLAQVREQAQDSDFTAPYRQGVPTGAAATGRRAVGDRGKRR
ncbi:hypothetical protein [Catellatospora paridis]|uniref:hypothetical protein n=1 Tax=Catellatospora paridis TaxID=1617086 RepID=UPI0012D4A841|nr:hypothetical protein [Catellatospora paridis]